MMKCINIYGQCTFALEYSDTSCEDPQYKRKDNVLGTIETFCKQSRGPNDGSSILIRSLSNIIQ